MTNIRKDVLVPISFFCEEQYQASVKSNGWTEKDKQIRKGNGL